MSNANRIRVIAAAAAALAVLTAADAEAGHRHRSYRGTRHHAEGYGVLKAGGYGLDRTVSPESTLDSFFGFEAGSTLSAHVQVGFTVDWLRRRDARSRVVLLDTPFDLPVEGVLDMDGTSTDLVPAGGILRLRFPVADGRLIPFVSGQLTYDLLRLSYREVHAGTGQAREQTEYFQGLGTTVAVGAEAALDSRVGLILEIGAHRSEPTNSLAVQGVPVDARVDAGGEFARFGVRFGLI